MLIPHGATASRAVTRVGSTAGTPRVAIAHDYLLQRGGAERVVLSMVKAFPDAVVHTLLYDQEHTFPEFADVEVVASPLNRIGRLRHYRALLPLLPFAARRLPVDADIVLASSSGWAHGFRADGAAVVVYCHSPARWLYQSENYLGDSSRWSPQRLGLGLVARRLRRWDRRHAARADRYLVNSRDVRTRVWRAYGRDAVVVSPPHTVDPDGDQVRPAALADWADGGYHLVVARLMPYKNVDAVIEAFAGLPAERLVVVGRGPEHDRLAAALPANARMLRDVTDAELRWVYAHADRLVAASYEDFGLTPLEAGSFGVPTLALRGGGYLDTVEEGTNGLFFDEPTAADIRDAVVRGRRHPWDRDTVRTHADLFSEEAFVRQLRAEVLGQAAGEPESRSTQSTERRYRAS